MRVLIDGNTLAGQKSGIGNYTYHLLREMAGILGKEEELTIGIRGKLLAEIGELGIGGVEILSTKDRSFRKYIPVPPRWIRGFDLYHQPNYVPYSFDGPTVVSIHDLSHRVFPQYHPRRRVLFLRAFEGKLKRAARIITISEFSRQEIIDILGVAQEKVAVTYLGASPEFRPLSITREDKLLFQARYGLPDKYFLYVGTIEPRKNLARLIEAFHLLKQEKAQADMKLVLAGGKGWIDRDIFDRVKELRLQEEIVFTGYIEGRDLPILYNLAVALVFPSLYEGFGLPPLEAMACGTPVISSDVSSIPEIVGDAGILIDPYQVTELAEAMLRVARSESLRAEMSRAGLERSRKFSWQRCAAETLQIYRECIRQP